MSQLGEVPRVPVGVGFDECLMRGGRRRNSTYSHNQHGDTRDESIEKSLEIVHDFLVSETTLSTLRVCSFRDSAVTVISDLETKIRTRSVPFPSGKAHKSLIFKCSISMDFRRTLEALRIDAI